MELIINNTTLRQQGDNICLSDIWKSSGGLDKKSVRKWINRNKTQELLQSLSNNLQTKMSAPFISQPSDVVWTQKNGLSEEWWTNSRLAVYDYAAWISVDFRILVYSVFDNHVHQLQNNINNYKRIIDDNNILQYADANTIAADNNIRLCDFHENALSLGLIMKNKNTGRYISLSPHITKLRKGKRIYPTLMYSEKIVDTIIGNMTRPRLQLLSSFFI